MADKTVACRLCASPRCAVIQASEPPFSVYRCFACDFAFVSPLPDIENLLGAYNQGDYYAEWVGRQAKRRNTMWTRRAKRVLGGLPAGRLLDVGCGEGSFLHAAQALGWEVQGTELSQAGCRLAKEQWGIPVFNGTLEQARLPSNAFDVVSLWHVIEHVPDPLATMREAARITRPGGRLVVACPNRNAFFFNLAYRIGRGHALQLFHPADKERHLSHFTVRSFRSLAKRARLTVERVDVDCGHVQRIHNVLDAIGVGWFKLTGLLWASAMEWWLIKSERDEDPT